MDTTTWLLADEAAEYMRMDRDSVYEYLQRGELRGVKAVSYTHLTLPTILRV